MNPPVSSCGGAAPVSDPGDVVGDQAAALAARLMVVLEVLMARLDRIETTTAGLAAAATEGVGMVNLRLDDLDRRVALMEKGSADG